MNFELRFTDKEITPWGGMALMKRMLDHLGFEQALKQAGLPAPGSNRGYAPEQLITQFMLSVWCGANRFEHGEVTRHDAVLQRIFGFARMANFKATMRLFLRFTPGSNEGVMDHLYRWLFGNIAIDGLTLDLDSTVMTRYGCQQGAAKGYNPAKRGRLSHHPLMAFVAQTQMVANCWLRPGNAGTANNVQGFLANTLHRLGGKKVALVRADSGFGDNAFLDDLEAQQLHYTIALRQTQPLQRALVDAAHEGHGWWVLQDERGRAIDGIELTRFRYQASSWSKPRWVTGIRQHIEKRDAPKGKTLHLFADEPVWAGATEVGGHEKGCCQPHPTHAADAALQALCEARVHHHREPQTHHQHVCGNAQTPVDAGPLGSRQDLRSACPFRAKAGSLKRSNGKSRIKGKLKFPQIADFSKTL